MVGGRNVNISPLLLAERYKPKDNKQRLPLLLLLFPLILFKFLSIFAGLGWGAQFGPPIEGKQTGPVNLSARLIKRLDCFAHSI